MIAMVVLMTLPSIAGERKKKAISLPYRHDLSVTWGMLPSYESMDFMSFHSSSYEGGLDNIYNNYMDKCLTSGVISLDYNIQLRKWLAVGVRMTGAWSRHTEMSSITGKAVSTYDNYSIGSLAYVKFTYFRRDWISMYSSIGLLGLKYTSIGAPKDFRTVYEYKNMTNSYQIAPLGLTVGKKLYGMAEMTFGSECFGVRMGVGYRF